MSAAWKPDSWRAKPVQQMAEFYPKEEATKVFDKLGKLPPLVQPAEVAFHVLSKDGTQFVHNQSFRGRLAVVVRVYVRALLMLVSDIGDQLRV